MNHSHENLAGIFLKHTVGLSLILFMGCSCSRPDQTFSPAVIKQAQELRSYATNEFTLLTVEAGNALLKMHHQGYLPGSSTNDTGDLYSELVNFSNMVQISYPAFRKFYMVKHDETATNAYLLEKISKSADWQIKRAWRMDTNGQIITEWQIK